MVNNTIDTLELQIKSDADSANRSLEKLAETLGKLGEKFQGLQNISGFDFSKSLKSGTEFEKCVGKIRKSVDALDGKPIDLGLNASGLEAGIEALRHYFKDVGLDFTATGSLSSIEKQIEETSSKLDRLFEKEEKLKNIGANINTQGFRSLEYDISILTNKLEILKAKQVELKALSDQQIANIPIDRGSVVPGIEDQIRSVDVLQNSMRYSQEAMKAVFGESYAHISNFSEAVQELGTNAGAVFNGIGMNVDFLNDKLEELNSESQKLMHTKVWERLKNIIASLPDKMDDFRNSLKSTVGITEKLKNNFAGLLKNAPQMRKMIEKINRSFSRNSGAGSKNSFGIGRMMGMSLLYSSVFQTISAIQNAIVEGSNNLVQYSTSYNKSISSVVSALMQLKNAFAVAFAPVVEVVAPILTSFIKVMSQALNKVGQFFAALTGKKFVPQAVGIVQDYASGLQKVGETSSGSLDKANNSAKKLKKTLSVLSFDQLNQLTAAIEGAGDSSLPGTIIGSGEILPENMFVDSPIASDIQAFADKIKKIFGSLFKPFEQAWNKEGASTVAAAQYAMNGLRGVAISVGNSLMEVWTNGTGAEFLGNILQISQNILNTIGGITRKFQEAWDKAEVGTRIIQHIFDLANTVLSTIKKITGATAEWAEALNFTPLLESVDALLRALQPLTEHVGDGLAVFWKEVLLPIASWTIQDAVPKFLNMISAGLRALDKVVQAVEPLARWLLDDFLKPLGRWAGDTVIKAFEGITSLLQKFGDWVSTHEEETQALVVTFGSLFASWKLLNGVVNLWNGISKIASGATTLLSGSFSILAKPIEAVKKFIELTGSAAGTAAKGGFKSLLSAIGASGAGIGLIAVLPVATSMLAGFVEKLMGGNGKLSTMGASINDLAGKLQQLGTLSKDQAEEVWSMVDAWENEGLSAQEMATKLMEKFSEWGLSTDAVNTVLQDNNYWTAQVKDNVDLLTESAGQLGEGFSRTAEQIDLSGVSMKDAMGGMRDALYELSLSGGEFSGTYQGILMSMDDTLASSATAQEALNMLAGQLEAAGIPADQFISKLKQRFPEATMAVKSSVDTNIAGAQQTMTTEMGKADKAVSDSTSSMKKNAENNLAGVKSAAELSASGVSDTTILSWGNSAREVTLKLREMKLAASTELGNMTETVRSFSESMYNIMTKKFEYLGSKIKQIISAMSKDTKSVFSSMLSGLSESTQKATNRIVNIFSRIPREISSSLGDNMYYAGRNAAVSFANGISSVHIPMPHISVDANTWSNGNGYSYRMSSSVNWYKSGGLFGVPSVIGVGEAGKEAVLPLENKRTMSMIADSIMSRAPQGSLDQQTIENAVAKGVAMAMMNNQQNPINVTCYAELKTEDNEVLARAVTKGQKSIDRRLHPTLQFGY